MLPGPNDGWPMPPETSQPGQVDLDKPGEETHEEIGRSLARQFYRLERKKRRELARLNKRRRVREKRLFMAEFYARKVLVIFLRLALIVVVAVIVILIAELCWPAIEAGLERLLNWSVPQN
jgi:type VI protein secretion system component VasF